MTTAILHGNKYMTYTKREAKNIIEKVIVKEYGKALENGTFYNVHYGIEYSKRRLKLVCYKKFGNNWKIQKEPHIILWQSHHRDELKLVTSGIHE